VKLEDHRITRFVLYAWYDLKIRLATRYRGFLGHTRFIGVTGSCGKTTTKELIGAILGAQGPGRTSNMITNEPQRVASTMLMTFPRHRFCVHELGGFEPQILAKTVAMFRPQIGVVTQVAYDHSRNFRSLEATAREKVRLVEALPASGTAVLNADDPRVLAMGERTRAPVITYGLSEEAMVRGADLVSAWPEPLSLSVVYKGERRRVETQLLGKHWASAVLAALATGIAMGVPLSEAAAALRGVPPVFGRLSEHRMADGVTFIQDTWKAPLYSVPASLAVLETARAPRKIAILGTITDAPGSAPKRYREATRQALEVADQVLVVGRWAEHALKVRPSQDGHRLRGFANIYEVRRFLRGFLVPGDLVLIKGQIITDHLERLVLDWEREFACWRLDCKKLQHCTDCRLRHSHFVPGS